MTKGRHLIVALAGFTLAAVGGCALAPSPFEDTDLFLTNVSVIDIVTGDIAADQTIAIRGDTILSIEDAERARLPGNASILASGGYAVPGLWDMHVHAMSDPDLAITNDFPLFIANGITGIRDMASLIDGIAETRSRLDADESLPRPHLYVSGPLLDGQALPWYGDLPLVLTTREDVERELPRLKSAGMDFFKVYDAIPLEAYEAVLEFATANDMRVAGHAPHAVDLKGAAESGQRTIEHLSPFGLRDCVDEPDSWFRRSISAKFNEGSDAYYAITIELFGALDQAACQEAFAAMASNGTFFTPTLVMELNDASRVPSTDLEYLRPESRDWCQTGLDSIAKADPERREETFAGYIELLSQVRAAGVTLLAGSDTPNNCLVKGFSLHWELERLVEAGLTPLEAIQSATLHAAAAMDRSADLGQVSPGFTADILLLKSNPLDDISNLRYISGVLANGRWFDEAARLRLLEMVKTTFRQEPS
ncbi:MAG: amidohydrolase family protein [Pseudomonadota bacterium]